MRRKGDKNKIVIRPNSGPQEAFFAASDDEVLYGGAAGGGKTWALVVEPLRYLLEVSEFTGIIFRRTYPELEGSVLPTAREIYGHAGAIYNETRKMFTFPSGATMRMGFMEHLEDWRNYQGHEYAYMGYDEATNFLEPQYTMLGTWSRSRCSVEPYRRLATNPGGVGHAWVKTRFVDPCPAEKDGPEIFSELANCYWQPMRPGPSYVTFDTITQTASRRKYIPSRVFDNKNLLERNPNYVAKLLQLPVEQRKAYLEGDWNVFAGQFFSQWRDDVHLLSYYGGSPENWDVKAGLDYGEHTFLEVASRDYEGNVVFFLEVYTQQASPSERATRIAEELLENNLIKLPIIYDTNMDISLEHYTGGEKAPAQIFRDTFYQLMGSAAPVMRVVSKSSTDKKGYRASCNEAFKEGLGWKAGPDGRVVQRPKLYVVGKRCPYLSKCIPTLVTDPSSSEGMDFEKDGAFDHPYDAAKMVYMDLKKPHRPHMVETWEQKFRREHAGNQSGWYAGAG